MTPAVLHAIEGLYTAFAAAKRPSFIGMSPVKDPADFASLITTPLRQLTSEQLWQYSFSLFNTVGDATEFEYFFPRIIELATSPYSDLEIEVVFQKPSMAGWPDAWHKDHRKAFQTYLGAIVASWSTVVIDIPSWVCALSFCLPDIDRHLDVLLSGTDAANENLLTFYADNCQTLPKNRLSNSFWDRSSDTQARVVTWLLRPNVQQKVQQLSEAKWNISNE